jgi:hypothetical protein
VIFIEVFSEQPAFIKKSLKSMTFHKEIENFLDLIDKAKFQILANIKLESYN